jgi:hypothetical protein
MARSSIHNALELHLHAVSDAHKVLEHARQRRNHVAAQAGQAQLCAAVEAAFDAGATWMQIDDLLGIVRGNAYQQYRRRPVRNWDSHRQSTLRSRMTPLRVSRWRQRAPIEEDTDGSRAVDWPAMSAHDDLQTLYGVPTFKALQDICGTYIAEHRYTLTGDVGLTCACRLQVSTYIEWVEHVTELQASHIAMAIQQARNTP